MTNRGLVSECCECIATSSPSNTLIASYASGVSGRLKNWKKRLTKSQLKQSDDGFIALAADVDGKGGLENVQAQSFCLSGGMILPAMDFSPLFSASRTTVLIRFAEGCPVESVAFFLKNSGSDSS